MKRTFKRLLGYLLAFVMVFGSMPLSGIVGIDFHLPDLFSVKASAYTDGIYTYTVSSGVATITDCISTTSGEIVIPLTLGGYQVKLIGALSFAFCDSLTKITIPNSVTSIGSSAFAYCSSLTNITIPDSVISIENSAFASCSSLTDITIPYSVTSIGDNAFSSCSSLSNIFVAVNNTQYANEDGVLFNKAKSQLIKCPAQKIGIYSIPNSVTSILDYAFDECIKLTSVTIPDSVTSIGKWAFWGCDDLMSVTIGTGVKNLGDNAFAFCSSLTALPLPDSLTSIGENAFVFCNSLTDITIPYNVTSIGDNAFYSCSSLSNIVVAVNNTQYASEDSVLFNKAKSQLIKCPAKKTGSYSIPNNVTSIWDYAFHDCISLMSVTIPDSVTNIGSSAFWGCDDLMTVTIGTGVTSIGDNAFEFCSSLTDITIPYSVTSIGDNALSSCSSLSNIVVAVNNTQYASEDGVLFNKAKSQLIKYPAQKIGSYSIPNSVTSIWDYAFDDCGNLTSVTIPDSVTNIGDWAFYSCNNLTGVAIGTGVLKIGDYAFAFCTSLVNLTIPSGLKILGSNAFLFCTGLTSVTIPDSVTSIGSSAFYNCSELTIYCVSGSYAESYAISNSIKYKLVLAAPLGLILLDKTDITVTFSWGAVIGATSYNVYRGTTKINTTPITTTTYTAIGLAQNTVYSFTVKAANSEGESPSSLALNVTTNYSLPLAPTGLSSPGKTDVSVDISWTASPNTTGYNVYSGATKLTATPITSTSYTATGLTQNTAYTFTVKAVNLAGESPASTALSVTTNYSLPLAPTGLTSPSKTDTTVNLSWTASANTTGYNIYIGATKLTATPTTSTTFTATGLTQNTAYSFTVKAVNPAGESPASTALSATTNYSLPLAPIGLNAPSKTDTTVNLSWTTSANTTGYNVYRGATKLTATPITTTTYTASGLTQNTTYSFTVTAVNPAGESPASTALNVSTNLSEFTIVNGVLIKYNGSGGAVTIPNGVTGIGDHAFEGCVNLTSVIIPNSVTTIGSEAFSLCSNLTSIIIPESISLIDDSAFYACHSLTIYGSSGSYVQSYADEYSIPFVCVGITSTYPVQDSIIYVKVSLFGYYKRISLPLEFDFNDDNLSYSRVVWSSDNSKVLIDQNGNITNIKTGARSANITIKLYDQNNNMISTETVKVIFYKYKWQLKKLREQSVVSDNYAQRNMSAQEYEAFESQESVETPNSTNTMQSVLNIFNCVIGILRKVVLLG